MMALAPIKRLIHERCGLSFEGHGEAALRGALKRRREALGVAADEHYLSRLLAEEGEFQELVNLLTINETYFYREPLHLRLIAEQLAPRILERRGRVRILSAGCSTGEEPYSVVIALREHRPDALPAVEIVASDIDNQALERARVGHYRSYSFRALDEPLRERHFEALPEGVWRVRPALREPVRFVQHNLLCGPPPDLLGAPFDIILFRNVSIYFDAATREAIQRSLLERLAPDGHLIVGNTETLSNDFGLLPLVARDGLFFFSRDPALASSRPPAAPVCPAERAATASATAAMTAPSTAPSTTPLPPLSAAPAAAPPPAPSLARARERMGEKRYRDAITLADALVEAGGTPPEEAREAHMLAAHAAHALQEDGEARRRAEAVLEEDPWSLDALMLLGNLARERGEDAEAVGHFRQALYHRPQCWPVHYLLAESYRRLGEEESARREYRILDRQLSGSPPDPGLSYFRLGATAQELSRLVAHRLEQMGSAPGGERGA